MAKHLTLEERIKAAWDRENAAGVILYRGDTLRLRTITSDGMELHLIHNACRDGYDRSAKPLDQSNGAVPAGDSGADPELARSEEGNFIILGNRFACLRFQCLLRPAVLTPELSRDFFAASLRFAGAHPALTLMYNGVNAGKTMPGQYWLLSFHTYDSLANGNHRNGTVAHIRGLLLERRQSPCYLLRFRFEENVEKAARILMALVKFMEGRNFNIFLARHQAYFIPREDLEIPDGFDHHRFGGLEMLGTFVMKSAAALEEADGAHLVQGIRQVSYGAGKQHRLEAYVQTLGEGGEHP